jgi:PPOX class probable F420-dependent enzyme
MLAVPFTIDPSTALGQAAARRLHEDAVGWLVTVSPKGAPQPVPIWFLWDGEASLLVYSQPDTPKLRNIAANPRVALHLNGDGDDGDGEVIIVHGGAATSDDPPIDAVPAYVEKYRQRMAALGWTPADMAADYSVPVRITAARLSGH